MDTFCEMRYVHAMTENADTRWEWRQGFGWVEHPVEEPVVVEDEREAAAA